MAATGLINGQDAPQINGEGASNRAMSGEDDEGEFRFRPFPQEAVDAEDLDSGADTRGPRIAFATPQPMTRGPYPSPYSRPEAGPYGTDPRKITRTRRASAMRNTNTPYSRPASMQRARVTFQETPSDLGPSGLREGPSSGLRPVSESAADASGGSGTGAGVQGQQQQQQQQGTGQGSTSGVTAGSPSSGWLASWGRAVRGLIGWQRKDEAPKQTPTRAAPASPGERRGGVVSSAEGRREDTGAGQETEEEAFLRIGKTLSMAEYQRLNEMLRSRLVQEEDRPQDQGSGRASGKLGSGFEQGGLAGSGTPGVHRTPQAGQGVFGVSPSPWGPVSERGSRRDSLAMTTSDQFFTPPDKAPPLSPADVAKAFMGVRPHTPAPVPSPIPRPGPSPLATASTPLGLQRGSSRATSSPIITSPAPTPVVTSPAHSQWAPHSAVYQVDGAYEGAYQEDIHGSARLSVRRPSGRPSYMSVQEVEGAGEEGAQQQQQQLGPYLGRPEQEYDEAAMQLMPQEAEPILPITRWTPLLTAGQGTKRRVSALEVESWQGIGVGPMRRVRQRATEFGSHGFPGRASASSSQRASTTFRPPGSDIDYPQQDTGGLQLGQGMAGQGQALAPFVPGRSVGLGTSGAPGLLGRRRPLLRRAARRTQGAQDLTNGAPASDTGAQLPGGGAAGAAQAQGAGAGGAEGASVPSGAKSQKAGEEVPSRSSHLAQKILDAIDYMASPGAPKASPVGAGPSARAGSGLSAGKGGLGLGGVGAGAQGEGLRLGEGELNDRVKRSMAATEQPPPMAPSAFKEAAAGVPGVTAGTGAAPAGTPVEDPGLSRRRKSGAGFRIRFEDDEAGPSEPSSAASAGPSITPFSFPRPTGGATSGTPQAGTETPRLPRPAFGAPPTAAPASAAAGGRGEKAQEPGPGGFAFGKAETPAGTSGAGAGTGAGAGRGGTPGAAFGADQGPKGGTGGAPGFSFGGLPAKGSEGGGFSFKTGSPEAGADALPSKKRPSGAQERDSTTAAPQTQTPTPAFSFSASPGSGSKPAAGGAALFGFGAPGQGPASAGTGAGAPGAAATLGAGAGGEGGGPEGESSKEASRVPGSSGGVSGETRTGPSGAGHPGAVGSDGVSTMAGLSSSSTPGAFAQGQAGPVFGATGKGFNFTAQFGSAQGLAAKSGSPASGQQGGSQGKENLESRGSWGRERDESEVPSAKRAAKRGFRDEEEGEQGGVRRKRGAEEEEGEEDGEIQPAWGSKARVSKPASGSPASPAGPSGTLPGAATGTAAGGATSSAVPAFAFGQKGADASAGTASASPSPLFSFGGARPSGASPGAGAESRALGEASTLSASAPGFTFGAGPGTSAAVGGGGGGGPPTGSPFSFGAAAPSTTPSASSSQPSPAPAFSFGAQAPSAPGSPAASAGTTAAGGSGSKASDSIPGGGAGFKFGAGGVSFGLTPGGTGASTLSGPSSASTSTPTTTSIPSFAFGASASSAPATGGFTFGATTPGGGASAPASTDASTGTGGASASPSTGFAFGAPAAISGSLAFGTSSSTPASGTGTATGTGTSAGAGAGAGKPAGAAPAFTFGASPAASGPASGSATAGSLFGASASSPSPFTFGAQPSPATAAASQSQASPSPFGAAPAFGATPPSGTPGATAAGAPLFGAAATGAGSSSAQGSQGTFVFGAPASSTPGGGGAASSPAASVFTFGSTGAASGGAAASAPASTAPFTFGATAGTPGAPGSGTAASSPAPFTFGSTPTGAPSASAPSPFQFGSQAPSPSPAPSFAFSFGAKPGTPAAPSPVFGAPNGTVQFGSMEDNSMNDEMGGGGNNAGQQQQQQQASPAFPTFGAQSPSQAAPFAFGGQPQVNVFGSPAPSAGASPFGGFGAGASPNPFGQQTPPQGLQPAGGPVFSAGAGGAPTPGGFALGASDSKRRPFMKAKKPLSRRK